MTSAFIFASSGLAGSPRIPQNPAIIPGWNDEIKTLHSVARKYFLLWVAKGRPKSGLTYEDMVSSKKEFKYALRACKSKVERRRADKLDSTIAADVAQKKFWSLPRMTSAKASLSNNIDDVVGPQNITEMWQQYYSTLLNSHKKDNEQNEQVQLSLCDKKLYCKVDSLLSNADSIRSLLYKLPLRKAVGTDGLNAEHLIYADPVVCSVISIFINLCLIHGHIPTACLDTVLTPIIKSRNGDVNSKNNYRPVAIATVLSKLFERFTLSLVEHHLITSCNQFGFKSGHSTDMCAFLLKQIAGHYNECRSPEYTVYLDASKAFDRIRHSTLFVKLINRNMPMCFVRILERWYSEQIMCIKWGNCISARFSVSNGVRQGGKLSPYPFAVYLDDLSVLLNNALPGCYVGNLLVNHLMHADDICCFCPSAKGLRLLLDICRKYADDHGIVLNGKKTNCLVFKPRKWRSPEPVLCLNNTEIKIVNELKYLGFVSDSYLRDDYDIKRQTRAVYRIANKLRSNFYLCSKHVKNVLYRSYCMPRAGLRRGLMGLQPQAHNQK